MSTNIDHNKTIRYGVISQHEVLQAWADSAEPNYGAPHCPECGNDVITDFDFDNLKDAEYKLHRCNYAEYCCHECKLLFSPDTAFGDEPICYELNDSEYGAIQTHDDSDIFVMRSPYYTLCDAGHLTTPGNVKAYCFGADWFDQSIPYPIFDAVTDELLDWPVDYFDVD